MAVDPESPELSARAKKLGGPIPQGPAPLTRHANWTRCHSPSFTAAAELLASQSWIIVIRLASWKDNEKKVRPRYPNATSKAGRSEPGTKITIQKKGTEILGFTKVISTRAAAKRSRRHPRCCRSRRTRPATSRGRIWTISCPLPMVAPVAYIERGINTAKARSEGVSARLSWTTK